MNNRFKKAVSVMAAVSVLSNSMFLTAFAEAEADPNASSDTIGSSSLIAPTNDDRVSLNLPSARDGYSINDAMARDNRRPVWMDETYEEYMEKYNAHPINIVSTVWADTNGNSVSGRFVKDTIYRATVTVTAKEGFIFTEDSIPNVRAVTERGFDVPDSNMTVSEDGTTLTIVYYSKAADGYGVSDSDTPVESSIEYLEVMDEIYVDGEKFDEHSTPIYSTYSDFDWDAFAVSDYTVTGFSDETNKVYEAGKEYTVSLTLTETKQYNDYDLASLKLITDVRLSHYDLDLRNYNPKTYLGSQNVTAETIDGDTIKVSYTVTPVEKVDISDWVYSILYLKPNSFDDFLPYQAHIDVEYPEKDNYHVWLDENNISCFSWYGPNYDKSTQTSVCMEAQINFTKNAYIGDFSIKEIYHWKSSWTPETADIYNPEEKVLYTDVDYTISGIENVSNAYMVTLTSDYHGNYTSDGIMIHYSYNYVPALYNYFNFNNFVAEYSFNNTDHTVYVTSDDATVWYRDSDGDYYRDSIENLIHNKTINITADLSQTDFEYTANTLVKVNPRVEKYLTNPVLNPATKILTFTFTPWFNYAAYDSATPNITATEPTCREDTEINWDEGGIPSIDDDEEDVEEDDDVAIEDDDNDTPDSGITGGVPTTPSTPDVPATPSTPTTPSAPTRPTTTPSTNNTADSSDPVTFDDDTATATKDATNDDILDAIDKLANSGDGKTLRIENPDDTVVDKELLDGIKGKDINLEIPLKTDNGVEYSWKINGESVEDDFDLNDIDLDVDFDTDNIPIDEKLKRRALGDRYDSAEVMQISLKHDGEFGFEGELKFNMGKGSAGKQVYLYYFNEKTGKLELAYTAQADKDGNVTLKFTHASEYVMIMCEEELEMADYLALDEEAETTQNEEHGKDEEEPEEDLTEEELEEIEEAELDEEEEAFEQTEDEILSEEDENPHTGVTLSFAILGIAGAAVLAASKKRK